MQPPFELLVTILAASFCDEEAIFAICGEPLDSNFDWGDLTDALVSGERFRAVSKVSHAVDLFARAPGLPIGWPDRTLTLTEALDQPVRAC
jgi:hypothetical protein